MEPNLNLYIAMLTITFSNFSGRCKVILYSNRTIYPRHTPRVRTLTQAQTGAWFSPSASAASCHLWKGAGTRCVRCESMPDGWGLWAHGPGAGKAAAAAKCSIVEVQATWILHHWENIHSLDVVHKVTFFFDPSVRTRIRIPEPDTVYQKTFSPLEKPISFFFYTNLWNK